MAIFFVFDRNVCIHLVVIPFIVTTLFGAFYCAKPIKHFKFGWKDSYSISLGDFTHQESNEVDGEFVARAQIVGWLIICSFYLKCDLITGVVAMLGGLVTCKIAYVITDLDVEEGLLGGQAV